MTPFCNAKCWVKWGGPFTPQMCCRPRSCCAYRGYNFQVARLSEAPPGSSLVMLRILGLRLNAFPNRSAGR
ncbi:hypothetical protein DMT39_17075 [Klebsiella variicola]|nr:hypothetical protein DMT18_16545 [Klebsiella variicola]PXM41305.1 hypothetical protein DMT39_17075 [Klebsiella variicola]